MENLAHTLFGAALYRAGFEKYAPGTLALWLVGANLPDIDVIAGIWGPVQYLQHHRGLSHSILGVVILAFVAASVARFWMRFRGSPVGWTRLFICSLAAVGTHPLLDYLNNYGVRPLLPFDGRWFYGDLVFIVDPWLWLILGGALFLQSQRSLSSNLLYILLALATASAVLWSGLLPLASKIVWIFGLAALAAARLLGGGFPRSCRVAFVLMAVYLGALFGFQRSALAEARAYIRERATEPVVKYSVSPSPANPLRWEVFAQTDSSFRFGAVRASGGPAAPLSSVPSANRDPLVLKAFETLEGRVVRDFSRYLIADVEQGENGSVVVLRDGRYARDRRRGFSVVRIPSSNNGTNGKTNEGGR